MLASQMVAIKLMDQDQWGTFFTLLRLYLLFQIPALGLQNVFAQQAAAAVTPERQALLAATVRAVHSGLFGFWLVLVAVAVLWQSTWLKLLSLSKPAALWVTLGLGLASLWVPVWKGIVQGRQHFFGLGWSLILDGVGRFGAVTIILLLGGQAVGGMVGALLGLVASLAVAFWVVRDILWEPGHGFVWLPWLKRVVPLTIGAGTFMLMTTLDVIYVRSVFPEEQSTQLYNPASMIGLALMVVTTPLVQVMFPKVARSAALTQGSRAMILALVAAATVGALAAVICTLMPELPLRVISFNNPAYLGASPLVPWFAWALLPLMLAMVLANNLLAQGRFAVVPWLALVAALYCGALLVWRSYLPGLEPLVAFKGLLVTLGTANLSLLALTILYSVREQVPVAAEAPSI
jgi:O-antigen/teichoic acid export membrane protein